MSELEQHHRYSASGAEGWMTCAGKVAMEEGIPDTFSPYADEGSAAHFLASECLLNKVDADTYLDRTIVCYTHEGRAYQAFVDTEDGVPALPEGAQYSSEWVVDIDMSAYVQKYVDRIWQDSKKSMLFVEQRVEFGEYIGDPGAFGTADAILVSHNGKSVKIRDLKYGFKPVSAVNNKQMMLYALGVLYSFDYLIAPNLVEEIDIGIVQPRTNSPDEPWVITPAELFAFAEEAKAAIVDCEEARLALREIAEGDREALNAWAEKYLTPSEKGCQWCKAKGKCPALAMESVNTMLVAPATADGLDDLDASTDMESVMDTALQRIPELDFDTVVNLYKVKDKIQIWIDAINDRMMHDMLLGFKTPHFKLVKGREGNRKWKSDTEVEAFMKQTLKLKVDEVYAKKVVTPAYAEKVIAKKYPKKWERLKEYITRSEAKLAVAPMDDKRESFDPHGEKIALLPDLTDLTVDDLL